MSDEETKPIYNMELHELKYLELSSVDIMRVPGGWIYNNYRWDVPTSVFIPFDNEFMNKE